jgi:hypothetical protein
MAITRYAGDRFTIGAGETKPTGVLDGAVLIDTGNLELYVKRDGVWVEITGAGTDALPGAPLNSVQFNDAGSFGGDADLTFTDGNRLNVNKLGISGIIYDSNNSIGNDGMVLTNEGTTGVNWKAIEDVLSGVGGSGVANYVARWADEDTLTSGVLYDNGTNVGVGTNSPSYKLDVGGTTSSTSNTLRLHQANGGTAIRVGPGGGGNDITLLRVDGSSSNNSGTTDSGNVGFSLKYMGSRDGNLNALSIFTDNVTAASQIEAVTILQDGNVGIGTTNPNSKLDVDGSVSADNYGFRSDSAAKWYYFDTFSGNNFIGRGANSYTSLYDTGTLSMVWKNGSVGIGTTNPQRPVTLYKASTPVIQLVNSTTGTAAADGMLLTQSGVDSYIENGEAGKMFFRTSATTRVTIDSSGNVGIGTVTPATKLDIFGQQYNSNYPSMLRVIDNVTAFDTDNNGGGISFGGRYTSGGVIGFLAGIQGVKENNTSGNYDGALRFLIRENGSSLLTEKMRIGSDGNVGIGTTSPNDKLEIYGNMRVRGSDGFGANSTANYNPSYVAFPGGGKIGSSSTPVTGYIKITLPQSWTNTMMQFSIDVFEYQDNKAKTFVVAGYNYSGDSSWHNTTAMVLAGNDGTTYKVQFGHDGSKCAIYISKGSNGASSSWTYPYVVVRGASFGFLNTGISNWIDGWDVSFPTSLGTITQTRDVSTQVTGSGTSQYIPKWDSTGTALSDSVIVQNNSNIGIGTNNPAARLELSPSGNSLSGLTSKALIISNTNDTSWTADALASYNATTGYDITDLSSLSFFARPTQSNILIFASEAAGTSTLHRFINLNSSSTAPLNRWDFYQYDGSGTGSDNFKVPDKLFQIRVREGASVVEKFTIKGNGNIGIGTDSPAQQLHLTGSIRLPNTTNTTTGIIYKDTSRFIHNYQHPTGDTAVPAGFNTFVGLVAGNLSMGSTATSVSHGSYNSGFGYQVLNALTTGYSNTAIGFQAGEDITTGYKNTIVGMNAGGQLVGGSRNTFIGDDSGLLTNSGINNTALGAGALRLNTTGSSNTIVGTYSLDAHTSPAGHTTLGYAALTNLTTGSYNIAIGYAAGSQRVATGDLTNSSYGIYLGYAVDGTEGASGEIVIGKDAQGLGSNTTRLGGSNITKTVIEYGSVGIGTTSPDTKLQIDSGSGIGTVDNAYSLAIRGDGIDGIQILSDSAYSGRIVFGDQNSNNAGRIYYDHSTDAFRFFTNGTEKVSILSGGNVGIGTASPESLLHLESSTSTDPDLRIVNTNNDNESGEIRFVKKPADGTLTVGDELGELMFLGSATDGTVRIGSRIRSLVEAQGSAYVNGNLTFSTKTSNTEYERVRITNGGNVGIGNTVSQVYTNENTSTVKLRVGSDTLSANQSSTIQIGGRDSSGGGTLGAIEFFNHRDDSIVAKIQVRRDLESSVKLSAGQIDFYTDDGDNNLNARMSIDALGKVGIGTISPDQLLHLYGSDANLRLDRNNTGYGASLEFNQQGNNKWTLKGGQTSGVWDFAIRSATGAERLTILQDGNVGIGTTNPTSGKLQVAGRGYFGPVGTGDATTKALMDTYSVLKLKPHDSNSTNMTFAQVNNGNAIGIQVTNSTQTADWDIALNPYGGNVGIGTDDPVTSLHVSSSATNIARFSGLGTAGTYIKLDESGTQAWVMGIDNGDTTLKIRKNDYNGDVSVSFASTRQVQFNAYGSGTFTGTATQKLAVDSSGNVIEIPIGSGPVDGSGAANKVTYWTDTDTISYNNNFHWDNTNGNLGVGTATPAATVQIVDSTSGASVLKVDGTNGTLFEVVDDLSGSLMSVNDAAGLPVFEVFADNHIVAGRYNQNDFYLNTNGNLGLGTSSPITKLNIKGDQSANGQLYIEPTNDSEYAGLVIKTTRGADRAYAIFAGGTGTDDLNFRFRDASAGVDRMVIDSSGNVGIGIVSPLLKLHVEAGTIYANSAKSDTLLATNIAGTVTHNMIGSAGYWGIRTATNNSFNLDVYNGGSPKAALTVLNDGNVGIGTTTPSYTLHTQGTIYASSRIGAQAVNTSYLATLGGSSDAKLVLTGSSSPYIRFQEGTTNRAYIQWLSTTDSLKFQNQQGDYFDFSTHDEGSIGLRLMGYSGAIWGYVYANSSSEGGKNIGLLDGGGSWAIRHVENTKTEWRIDNDIKMTLLASGNVGIGTTNPEAGLHIYGSGQQSLFVGSSNGARALLELDGAANGDGSGGDYAYLAHNADGSFDIKNLQENSTNFATGSAGTIRMTITSGGNVGIGTTSPGSKLDVNGMIKAGIAGNSSANTPALLVSSAGVNPEQSAIAIQQGTTEGDTIIFADYEPYVEWGLSTDNGLNTIEFTGGTNTNNLGSKTLYNQSGNARTAYKKAIVELTSGNMSVGGSVGIGTASPSDKLHVVQNIDLNTALFQNTSGRAQVIIDSQSTAHNSYLSLSNGGSEFAFLDAKMSVNLLRIATNNTGAEIAIETNTQDEAVRIDSAGNVGIGTTNPGAKLHVNSGQVTIYDNLANPTYGDGSEERLRVGRGANQSISFKVNDLTNTITAYQDESAAETHRFVLDRNSSTSGIHNFHIARNGSYQVTVDRDGKFGIGAQIPDGTLHVVGGASSESSIALYSSNVNTNDSKIKFQQSNGWQFTAHSYGGSGTEYEAGFNYNRSQYGGDWYVGYDGSRKLTVTSAGNVGIGANDPQTKLHLSGGSTSLPIIRLQRNDTSVQPDDLIGGFENYSNDADGAFISSYVKGYATETYGRQGYLTFGTAGTNSTDATEKMRIAADGNVGIGTTNPSAKIDVVGASVAGGAIHSLFRNSADANSYLRIENNYANAAGFSAKIAGYYNGATQSGLTLYSSTGNTTSTTAEPVMGFEVGTIAVGASQPAFQWLEGSSPRMTIDKGGNFGIGITNPQRPVTLYKASNPVIQLVNSTTGTGDSDGFLLTQTGLNTVIENSEAGYMAFRTTADEKMRIDASGNVGIGTPSPTGGKLQVAGKVRIDAGSGNDALNLNAYDLLKWDGANLIHFGGYQSSQWQELHFYANGAKALSIDASQNVGIGTTTPGNKLHVNGSAVIGDSTQTSTILTIRATNTAGAPAATAQILMEGYEGRGIGTFYTDSTYSGEEWFCGMNYSGNFNSWNIGYDQAGGQAEYLANTKLQLHYTGKLQLHDYGAGTFTGTATQRLAVDASGNVIEIDIGSGAVDGSGTDDYIARWTDTETLGIGKIRDDNSTVAINTAPDSSYMLKVAGNGYFSGTLTEASSLAIKENIENFTPSIDKINKIRPVKYNKKGSDKKEIGLIAEELEELFPELVEKDENGNPSGVNYSRAVTVLLGGFKELYKELQEIKKRI